MTVIRPLLLVLACIHLGGCEPPAQPSDPVSGAPGPMADAAPGPGPDPHSFANFDQVRVHHLVLDLTTDFAARRLTGSAELHVRRDDPTAGRLVLDTRDLSIEGVFDAATATALPYRLGDRLAEIGRPLVIELGEATEAVRVDYATRPEASGLQWLTPAQTQGGRHPFLFSQSQAIHARTWIPLQDTPAVRFTYEAHVLTPPVLRAVMSAHNDPDAARDGDYRFTMPQAIPSYLMALAVGDLVFEPMSERTGIYAEPAVAPAAAREFEDTEAMMRRCEALFGPYRWGRYDLLILPPSFPFGGMENPRLSFITPTVIAGDKSLVALIAHELAHSWSGNLVTNARWSDLWLNEGFTVYLEARIMEAVFGPDRRRMEDVLGYQSLVEDMATLADVEEHLRVERENPDDVFSDVPYEKGRLLLVWLESRVGREAFDAWLRGYFDRHAFSSLTTEEFLVDLEQHLLARHPTVTREEVLAWIDEPGLPEVAVLPHSDAFEKVAAQARAWLAGERAAADLETGDWTVHQWLYFINNLPDGLEAGRLAELDAAFDLTGSRNAEIAHSWLRQAIRHRYEPALPRLEDYLVQIGRRKLIEPLYQELMARDWGRELARTVYRKARPGYHPQAARAIDRIVGLDAAG